LNLNKNYYNTKLCYCCTFPPLTAALFGNRIKYNLEELIEEDPLYGYYKEEMMLFYHVPAGGETQWFTYGVKPKKRQKRVNLLQGLEQQAI